MLKVLIIAISLLLASAAGAEVYEGHLLERDGLSYKPRSVEPFSGLQRGWSINGQLRLETNYKDGKREGLRRSWENNGVLTSELCFSNGEEVDISECR